MIDYTKFFDMKKLALRLAKEETGLLKSHGLAPVKLICERNKVANDVFEDDSLSIEKNSQDFQLLLRYILFFDNNVSQLQRFISH